MASPMNSLRAATSRGAGRARARPGSPRRRAPDRGNRCTSGARISATAANARPARRIRSGSAVTANRDSAKAARSSAATCGSRRLGTTELAAVAHAGGPVDRGRTGSKHHLITDATGIPLTATLTGGNRNDVTQLIPLLQAVPPVRGKRGRPRRRPDVVLGDRGYDHDKYRRLVWDLGVKPLIAPRGTEHGSGLGTQLWLVERAFAHPHWFRRADCGSAGRSETTPTSLPHPWMCTDLLAAPALTLRRAGSWRCIRLPGRP